jgi:WD40 repeat protein
MRKRWIFVLLLLSTSAAHAQDTQLLGEIVVNSRTNTAYDLEWHPDGEMLAAVGGFVLTLYDHDLHEVAPEWEIGEFVDVSWKPDGTQLAGAGGFESPEITLWDYDNQEHTFELATSLDGGADQYVVSWSPDGTQLASLADDRASDVQIWDVEQEEMTAAHQFPYTEPARSLVWSADGSQISSVGLYNRRFTLYTADVETGEIVGEHHVPQRIWAFDLSPERSLLAAVDQDGTARIIDLATDETRLTFESVAEPVAVKWSPDGETLAILSYRTNLQLWSIAQMLEETA